ncbi:DUF3365 domain-containing protein [Cytophagaceae bacterium ABcell3]|nr:DUF3365 domain-containing protein [Cytophagaceae bacterium ABcell3]
MRALPKFMAFPKGSILCLTLLTFVVVSCGDPLPEETSSGTKYPIEEAFTMLAQENDAARTLYTKAIVDAGKLKGLAFDEDWQKNHIEAGPLPALFLRATSMEIQKTDIPLGLFLGSDFPVNQANEFTGKQKELFEKIKEDKEPKFFFDEKAGKHTAMFPDFAVVQGCVTCHNEHPESPKDDWKLGDIMGATTWTFPKDSVTVDEMKALLRVYRMGASKTYQSYLDKTNTFKDKEKPIIGAEWPAHGYSLPETAVFVDSISKITSHTSLNSILKY